MLLAPLVYASAVAGETFTIPAGFVSDGESIPRQVAWLSGPPCRKAGIVHDWLTQTHLCSFEQAVAVYREALLALKLHEVYADQRAAGVDFYGHGPWESGPARRRVLNPGVSEA